MLKKTENGPDCADAHADLELCYSHTRQGSFSHVEPCIVSFLKFVTGTGYTGKVSAGFFFFFSQGRQVL